MTVQKINFYQKLPSLGGSPQAAPVESSPRIEPSTCVEAESFVLRVLDDSMQPEFKKDCIIVVDPTGVARDGSYVLAHSSVTDDPDHADIEGYIFRQLKRLSTDKWSLVALNPDYASVETTADLSSIAGVIIQRAGTRRRYHKHYV